MKPLQPRLVKQATLGLVLSISAWSGVLVSPSVATATLGCLSLVMFWSQLNFAQAHALAERAQASMLATFSAFPDAIVVIRADGTVGYRKDFSDARPEVLNSLLTNNTLAHPELLVVRQKVQEQDVSHKLDIVLNDGRVLECRLTPYNGQEVLLIARDITEAHQDSERIRYLATHDSLTGLLNRNSFHVALDQAIRRADRSKQPFGLLFLDLDHFKSVNDTLGHEAGDSLLIEVSARLRRTLRKSDAAYRLAGDEFTVLIERLETPSDIYIISEKIRHVLAQPYFDTPNAPAVTASIGAVIYPTNGSDAEALLRMADSAMYAAKAKGRNTTA